MSAVWSAPSEFLLAAALAVCAAPQTLAQAGSQAGPQTGRGASPARSQAQPAQQHPFKVPPALPLRRIAEVAPLTPRQKFHYFGAFTIDPVTFGGAGAVAGIEQGINLYRNFGQGGRGYGRRYGTAYTDLFTDDFLGEALLPTLFKQDPRYFYKGEGSLRERAGYALGYSVIGRGDNHRRQVNYSRLLGDLGSGGLSNLYYPARDRHGPALTLYSFGFGIGAQALTNLVQEFILHKSTDSN